MRVEILTIGDELLLGFTIDSNAAYLARALGEVGIEVVRHDTVGDEGPAIAEAVRGALDRTGGVVTTGGLGPTSDDLTRPSIAALFGRTLRRDDVIVAELERRFRALGYGTMPRSNLVQAMVPEGARVLENRHGSAPGLWLEDERGRWVAMLPGVPREMRGMTRDVLLPLLRERSASGPPVVVLSRTLRTTGIGESALAEKLGDDGLAANGLRVAYLPGWEGVDLRLTVRGAHRDDADAALAGGIERLRLRAGRYVYGEEGDDLAAVVLDLCRRSGMHVATAESCTGGLLGGRLTSIEGSSDVYLGGVVAYANAVKVSLLGVGEATLTSKGAVSEEVASEMASGARTRLDALIGIGITGIAGPGGGTPEKPVGTVWIAVDIEGRVQTHGRIYVGDRDEIRRRATQSALDMVRRALSRDDALSTR